MPAVEWTIARRYIFSRDRGGLVSAITLIATAGVAIGVGALIAVLAAMDGALSLFTGNFTNLYPHLKISSMMTEEFTPPPVVLDRLLKHPEVKAAVPVRARPVFMQKLLEQGSNIEAEKKGLLLIALEPDQLKKLYPRLRARDGGELNYGEREIILGAPLAFDLQCEPGSPVRVAGASLKAIGLRVGAIFDSGYYAFDSGIAFVTPAAMARIAPAPPGLADYIHVTLADPLRAAQVRDDLQLDLAYQVQTWEDQDPSMLFSIRLQKYGLFIILLLITLVAALNIIGTLILMVIEKTREIGILKALGAKSSVILRIFLIQGAMIGAVGTASGVGLGLLICAGLRVFPIKLPPSVYNFTNLPVRVDPFSVAMIVIAAMLICTLASLFPARHAGRLNPVEALRHD